ncbi:MAG: rhodanese-like domain-containing protein, partial [Bacteroidaceae bacterium]|nr:rhodanese-like domain-containing protein [Bacteroidaceae bacterium]
KASLQSANLDKTKTLAVYCRSGRRSKAAANVLVEQGFRVVELDKGIIGWQQAGYPVAK